MGSQEAWLHLESPAARISGGIDAISIMTMGLAQVRAPYADGFNAVWNYLVDAERDFQKQLLACQNAEMD